MKIIITLVVCFAVSAFIYGCNSSSSLSGDELSFVKGNYTFTMKDRSDNKIADGEMSVLTASGNNVSGTYRFTKKYIESTPGMETMDGEFSGTVQDTGKTVWLNTNPKIADANVFVNMRAGKYAFYGTWNYSTMMGSQANGYFTVTPVRD